MYGYLKIYALIYLISKIYYSLNIPFLEKTIIFIDGISSLISEYMKRISALSECFLVQYFNSSGEFFHNVYYFLSPRTYYIHFNISESTSNLC